MRFPKVGSDVLVTMMARVALVEVKLVVVSWRIPPYVVPAMAQGMVYDWSEVNVKLVVVASANVGRLRTTNREKMRQTVVCHIGEGVRYAMVFSPT